MSLTFPRSRGSKRGYDIAEVDAFLANARSAYDAKNGQAASLRAITIRHTAFALRKGGYSVPHVDAALERLEDAFALRERERAARAEGDAAWVDEARTTAQVIVNRLARPIEQHFTRCSWLTVGYSTGDVDRFANRLSKYFRDSANVGIDDVRTVVFRPQRGGYSEAQVDHFLDTVIDVMLAVR